MSLPIDHAVSFSVVRMVLSLSRIIPDDLSPCPMTRSQGSLYFGNAMAWGSGCFHHAMRSLQIWNVSGAYASGLHLARHVGSSINAS